MVDVVGIIRFSVLSTAFLPFRIHEQSESFDQICERILAPGRLAERFRLFETITLPTLDAQTDQAFRIVVVAPRLLPEIWKRRLKYLADLRDYLVIIYEDETNFSMRNVSPFILDEIINSNGIFYTFRMDDDDGLAMNFVERVRKFMRPQLVDFCLSLCREYFLDVSNSKYKVEQRIVPNLAVGFGYISSAAAPRTIFDFSELHHRSHLRLPVITDATRDAFVAVTHDQNDSGLDRRLESVEMSAGNAAQVLRSNGFAVELEQYADFDWRLPQERIAGAISVRPEIDTALRQGLENLRRETKQQAQIRRLRKKVKNASTSVNDRSTIPPVLRMGRFLYRKLKKIGLS